MHQTCIVGLTLTFVLLSYNGLVTSKEDPKPQGHANPHGKKGPPDIPQSCDVNKFRLPNRLDLSSFKGEWFVTSDKGMFPGQHKADILVSVFTNFRFYFSLKNGDQVKVEVAVSKYIFF